MIAHILAAGEIDIAVRFLFRRIRTKCLLANPPVSRNPGQFQQYAATDSAKVSL
jgi:hypothetical protein